MVFFSLDGVLRGFPAATYIKYASLQTLVRPGPAKKIRIYELDTLPCLKKIADGHELTERHKIQKKIFHESITSALHC
jgi:hypothetical protein